MEILRFIIEMCVKLFYYRKLFFGVSYILQITYLLSHEEVLSTMVHVKGSLQER